MMGAMMMPAKVRLGKVLILVDIIAVPSMLPLPTLSKSRLPINHLPITQAFHLGLRDCLRSLQLTSPGLLLTSVQLRTVERDVRYIPFVASAAANILSRMQDHSKQVQLLRRVKQMHDEDRSNLDPSRDPESPLQNDEIIHTFKERTTAAILAVEGAKKKRTKRAKSTKQNEPGDQEYCDLEFSDGEVPRISSVVSHEETCLKHRSHSVSTAKLSFDDESFHSASPLQELTTQNNDKLERMQPPSGIALECDVDDDEWW